MYICPKHFGCRTTLLILLAHFHLCGQLVQIGRTNNSHACEKVKVDPNLFVETPCSVNGIVQDPFDTKVTRTRIEVRRYGSALKQRPYKQTLTDPGGRFSLGVLPAGRYRLLVFAPGFQQPRLARCSGRTSCDVKIVLEAANTDTFPESICPPK